MEENTTGTLGRLCGSDGAKLTYLVTGAAGFISSKVCEMLLAAGHTVVGIDNLNDYYDVRVKDYRLGKLLGDEAWRRSANPRSSIYRHDASSRDGRFIFRPIDIEGFDEIDALFREFRFAAIFNLGARAGVRASMENPHLYLATNTAGTLNLLECQRRHEVRKLVLASTSSLYAGSPIPWSETLPVNTPLSPYAASKKAAEMMAFSYHQLYQLDVSIVRYFTVFGPAGRPDMSIFRFMRWIDAEEPLELFGDGTQGRDFTYIDDIARGTILAARPLGFEIINLGGGRSPITLLALIAILEAEIGRKATIRELPAHVAEIRESWADIAKAERLLGWRPEVSIEDGLRRTAIWYRENREWISNLNL